MALLNIAALSQRTGVARDTLRKWEQRYGVLTPIRTPGGQRRYSEVDLARVQWLKARLAEGYRIGEAAALLGSATGEAPGTPTDLRNALYDAAREASADELGRLLEQCFTLYPLERALTEIVQPLLERIGEGWASGEVSVAQEHLTSGAVRARLERLLADTRGSVRGVVVLACAPGELHELGLLMLAVLLRADGWQVAYLGADTPVEAAVSLADTLSARALCFSAAAGNRVEELARDLAGTPLPPGLTLVVGGAAVEPETAKRLGAAYVNGDLSRAVRAIGSLAA